MSSEHAQFLRELGLTGDGSDAIKVQHVFVFAMSEKLSGRWEKIVKHSVDGSLEIGRYVVSSLIPTIKLLAGAVSVYMVLTGTARLVEAWRTKEVVKSNDDRRNEET